MNAPTHPLLFILCFEALVLAIINLQGIVQGQSPANTIGLIRKKQKMQNLGMQENKKYEKQCDNPSKLMPLCDRNIPGVQFNKEIGMNEFTKETKKVRDNLVEVSFVRNSNDVSYPDKYFASGRFHKPHVLVGKFMDKIAPKRVLDIDPKMNPIIKFMSYCPETVFMIDTRGELADKAKNTWSSKEVSCGDGLRSIQNVIPQAITAFIHGQFVQHFAAVVCMSCDYSHSPSWEELMALPRPFHLVLEFSNLRNYPKASKDGCSVVLIKKFDFSRTLVAYRCGDYPQETSRVIEAKKVLAPSCDKVQAGTYKEMACRAEELLFTSSINDSSLLAVNSLKKEEDEDLMMLEKRAKQSRHKKAECKYIEKYRIARTWWDIYEDPSRLANAKMHLNSARESENLFDALCYAGKARNLFSAAEPQEKMIVPLYDSIRVYQSLLQKIIAEEPTHVLGYRYHLKTCPPFLGKEYIDEVSELEPILPDGRNLDYREFNDAKISFNPYRPLASFKSVRTRNYRRRILVDVGANGFAASPKQLMDNYAALGMPFDEVHMFEPDIKAMIKIPDLYRKNANITFHKQYVEVGTRDVKTDILSWIKENVDKDDFLVLKFDVDEGSEGPTMEWGFLGDLIYSDALALVDEFYTEMHFRYPGLRWSFTTHSARQRYDVVRQLRACGMAIHDWP